MKFGSAVSYLMTDLIELWQSCGPAGFEKARDRYLEAHGDDGEAVYFRQLDCEKMGKIVDFIDRYVDSVTCDSNAYSGGMNYE